MEELLKFERNGYLRVKILILAVDADRAFLLNRKVHSGIKWNVYDLLSKRNEMVSINRYKNRHSECLFLFFTCRGIFIDK